MKELTNRVIRMYPMLMLLLMTLTVMANEQVTLTARAPQTVIMGKPFQVSYTANAKVNDFRAPAITNFDILAGPFKSESYSSQIVNGSMTSTVSISFTYTLQPQKTGTFTIPSAGITVNGERYTSNGLSIKVLPADDNSAAASGSNQASATNISSQNLFIRPILSRSNVYEQEAITLTYKLYTTYDVVQFNVKSMPDFKGFLKQESERTGNTQLNYENYNGRNYLTAILYDVTLFPQSPGEIEIDKAAFEVIIRVQSRQQIRSIFDEFFESYSNVARTIDVPASRVNVKPFPAGKPASFYGLVGQYSISSSISSNQVKVNEAVTLKVNVSGSGNLRLIRNPEFKFPEAFEVYDPKVTNQFKAAAGGLTGSKAVELMFIPRYAGSFEIPPYEVAYFDPRDEKYKVLKTPAYNLQILKSDGTIEESVVVNNVSRKEDVRQLGTDIRYIVTEPIALHKETIYFINQFSNWLFLFFAPFLLTLALFILFRKHVKENADLSRVRNKRANKIARKRLKLAQQLLKQGNKDKFYEEVMKAIWSYLSDKLTIPVAELNKDRVAGVLSENNVDEKLVEQLNQMLFTCEFARFAPHTGQEEMGNLYQDAINVISQLEDVVKK